MAVYKEEKTNTWRVIYRYTDWKGEGRQSQKRGFATKREAQAWEREQLNKTKADLDMTFASFVDTYTEDMKSRIKENTWHTKEHIMRTKILPYFKNRKMCEIEPKDIIAWQNEMINSVKSDNKKYSPDERMFEITKSYLHHEMTRGAKAAGVKRIRIHDIRHSHISLLIEMGFSAVAIADRVGHESIDITYRYAHLFPTTQTEMADKLSTIRKGDEENVS